jgi:uncharacterized protein YndB with AHSA1/START domain
MSSRPVEETTRLQMSRIISAPPKTVFKAWTDPTELKCWWGPAGFTTPSASIDLRVGGAYRISMKSPDGDVMSVAGVFRQVEAPKKLVYTWAWDEDGGPGHQSLVTVSFVDRGGSTEVVLSHERLADADSRDRHEHGWTECFDRLVELYSH